jgi:formate dehydrogenase maturation protein FdhE
MTGKVIVRKYQNETQADGNLSKITEQMPVEMPKRPIASQVVRSMKPIPSVAGMLSDALSIMSQQIDRLKVKSGHQQQALDERESRILQGYVKSLIDIAKEDREREKTDKSIKALENMSTEELLEMAKSELSSPKKD